MKRKLADQEIAIYSKQILKQQLDLELVEGELKRVMFNIEHLINHNARMQHDKAQGDKTNIQARKKELDESLAIMRDHVTNGVDVKENSKGSE